MQKLTLKPGQKREVQAGLSQAVARAIALLRAVQVAAVNESALPSPEVGRALRSLSREFSTLAGAGVAKAGRKMAGSRATRFRKAIKILLEIAKELGLEGSANTASVAWPLDVNKEIDNG
jgi:predicted transcriptional regulator